MKLSQLQPTEEFQAGNLNGIVKIQEIERTYVKLPSGESKWLSSDLEVEKIEPCPGCQGGGCPNCCFYGFWKTG